MIKSFRSAFPLFRSADLKPVVSPIQNLKWLGTLVVAFVLALGADVAQAEQSSKMPQIGFLTGDSFSAISERTEAFRQGLREHGYVEGKNIAIHWRSTDGRADRTERLAAELVRLKPDVIVAVGSGDIRAAKAATSEIPIVMVQGGDAVASGFVLSLARPGGNITGLSTLRPELTGKRLELLKEIIPLLSRVAVLSGANQRDYTKIQKELEGAAKVLGVKLQYLPIRDSNDIEAAFRQASRAQADAALFSGAGPYITPRRSQIATFAVKHRLPVIYERAAEAEAGGLMSFGVNNPELYRRAAAYVDKILKGATPTDLPVEQPTKFEFVINLKAAKQIGLTIPANVLARADRVIR
jgi:putative tryptophan/tyrosine transport system substrate-binding protein